MNTIDQYTIKPVERIGTPHCLTKGGETNHKYSPLVSLDYFRATFTQQDASQMREMFGCRNPQPVGRPVGYRHADKYQTGWIRQHQPYQPDRDGKTNYETWELPGAVQHDELKAITTNCPGARLRQCHIALDYKEQQYPSPWKLRELLADSEPRTKSPRGRRYEGDDGSETWYLGKKKGTMMLRVYQKGMQQQTSKENIDAPTDWTRCEFEIHENWLLDQAWEYLKRDDIPALAVNLATYFFKGDTHGLMPKTPDLKLKTPDNEYSPNLLTIYHFLKQYGPLMQALDNNDQLGPLLALVKPSRTAKWRNEQISQIIEDDGIDSVCRGLAKMFGQPVPKPTEVKDEIPF